MILGSPLIYPEHPQSSLVQVYDMVTVAIDDLVQHCAVSVASYYNRHLSFVFFRLYKSARKGL